MRLALRVGFVGTFLSFTKKELDNKTIRWWHYSFRQPKNSIILGEDIRMIKCPAIIAQCHRKDHFNEGFKIIIAKEDRDQNNLVMRRHIHPELLEYWDRFHEILLVADRENRIEWRAMEAVLNC